MFSLKDYRYDLPEELIAQTPADRREESRLLVMDRGRGQVTHRRFSDLPEYLDAGDVLVVNDTRVIPGRIIGKKSTGGRAEVLLLNYGDGPSRDFPGDPRIYDCLIKASKRPRPGTVIGFGEALKAEVMDSNGEIHRVAFYGDGDFDAILHRIGRVPLPPYIRRDEETIPPCDDIRRYQTVYAEKKGAIAAPTAGLHFTPLLLDALREKGVEIAVLTLHVGYGTFLPVRETDIRKHVMHAERYEISMAAAGKINEARRRGNRVMAVGTTSVRTLEYTASEDGTLAARTGLCDLFIYPGFRFKAVDAMVTNFHLPESTLLMLVSAFAGLEPIRNAYRIAVEEKYRFFSYGDAMVIV